MLRYQIVKKFITKCNHCVEEYAIIMQVRNNNYDCNTCPICKTELFEMNKLEPILIELSHMLLYCDLLLDNEITENECTYISNLDTKRKEFVDNYQEYWNWMN